MLHKTHSKDPQGTSVGLLFGRGI